MKFVKSEIILLAFSVVVMANSISVEVRNIDKNRPGDIVIFLFGEEGFPLDHSKALNKIVSKANRDILKVQFTEAPEKFAIRVLHDEDENGKVTKNWMGIIPREGLGFSNSQTIGPFGPPRYEA